MSGARELKPVQNQDMNRFCGPAVISSIVGITSAQAEELILQVRNKKRETTTGVKGVWSDELAEVFKRLEYNVTYLPRVRGYSIYTLMMVVKEPGVYIFFVPHHVIAIEIGSNGDRYICDNQSKKPLSLSSSARLGQRVTCVMRIEKKG